MLSLLSLISSKISISHAHLAFSGFRQTQNLKDFLNKKYFSPSWRSSARCTPCRDFPHRVFKTLFLLNSTQSSSVHTCTGSMPTWQSSTESSVTLVLSELNKEFFPCTPCTSADEGSTISLLSFPLRLNLCQHTLCGLCALLALRKLKDEKQLKLMQYFTSYAFKHENA
jgi:hypothetical protein